MRHNPTLFDLLFSNFSWTHPYTEFEVNGTANPVGERETRAFPRHITAVADDFHQIFYLLSCHFGTRTRATSFDRMMRHLHRCRGHTVFVFSFFFFSYIYIYIRGIKSLSNPEKTYFSSINKRLYIYINMYGKRSKRIMVWYLIASLHSYHSSCGSQWKCCHLGPIWGKYILGV